MCRFTTNGTWRGAGFIALALRVEVPENAVLRSGTAAQFFATLGRVLAWPHIEQPWAVLGLNLPMAIMVIERISGRRRAWPGEDFVLLLGGWAWAGALAAAWARGGSDEFAAGTPSRYADFFILLPLANAWCVVTRALSAPVRWRASARWVAVAWGAFLFVGWLGLSAQMWRGDCSSRERSRGADPAGAGVSAHGRGAGV